MNQTRIVQGSVQKTWGMCGSQESPFSCCSQPSYQCLELGREIDARRPAGSQAKVSSPFYDPPQTQEPSRLGSVSRKMYVNSKIRLKRDLINCACLIEFGDRLLQRPQRNRSLFQDHPGGEPKCGNSVQQTGGRPNPCAICGRLIGRP